MGIPTHFKLAAEGPHHYEIHDERDNSRFKIAKQDLNLNMHANLSKIKKLSDGTTPESFLETERRLRGDSEDNVPQSPEPQAPGPQDNSQPQASPGWSAPMLPNQAGTAAPQIQGYPQGTGEQPINLSAPLKQQSPDAMAQFQANQAMEEKGLQTQGNAQAAKGAEEAQIYKDHTEDLKNFLYNSEQAAWNQNVENENLANDVASTKVDPKNYMHSLSTGQKIQSAIAMLVGGIGAGLSHGPNLAVQTIQKAIDQDIEAQKENLGTKKSLLSMNLAKYKDMRSAEQATMMQMNAMAQGQLAQVGAKYGGIAGQAGTTAALGQLKNKNLQDATALKGQIFQQQIAQHLATGDVANQNPLDYVKWTVPPDKQKEVANEIGQAQYATKNHDYLMNLFDRAQKEQTAVRRLGGIRGDSPALNALNNAVLPVIKDTEGRVNEFEHESVKKILPGMFKLDTSENEQKKDFERFIEGKKNAPLSKTYGIDINRFDATKPREQEQTKTVNGVTYKRGPRGEAIKVGG